MDDFVCSSPVNPVAAALLGLGGSISREHRGKPKRILIEPKSMSAHHHLALSVEHRTTPLTLSIAPRPTLSKQSLHGLGPLWTAALRVVPRVQKGSRGLGPSPDYETTVVTLSTVPAGRVDLSVYTELKYTLQDWIVRVGSALIILHN